MLSIQAKAEQEVILRNVSVQVILQDVCSYFHCPIRSVKLRSKDPLASTIRSIAGYIIRHHTRLSQTALAKLTRRSTSTISDSINRLEKKIRTDDEMKNAVDAILDKISTIDQRPF